jgi:hypothetical protein
MNARRQFIAVRDASIYESTEREIIRVRVRVSINKYIKQSFRRQKQSDWAVDRYESLSIFLPT